MMRRGVHYRPRWPVSEDEDPDVWIEEDSADGWITIMEGHVQIHGV
jgi:hypothetical protein